MSDPATFDQPALPDQPAPSVPQPVPRRRSRFPLLLLAIGIIYAFSGLAVIPPDEEGVVRRFGAMLEKPWPPGLHIGLPWPLDRLDRVKTGQTKTLTVGAPGSEAAPLTTAPNPVSDDVLTGDLNLVTAQVILQYRIANPGPYLFATPSAEAALKAVTESALTRAVAGQSIDDILTTRRSEVGDQVARLVQEQADRLSLGVSIRAARLGRVTPPMAVAPAFADAARAKSDQRQAITAAEEYRDRAQADATSREHEIADRAAAQHDRAIELAKGEADRFARFRSEAERNLDATRRRLYLEAVAALLPRFARTLVVAPGQSIDLGLFSVPDEIERAPSGSNAAQQ